MKTTLLPLLFVLALFSQCRPPAADVPATPKITYDQASIELMKEITPQIHGTWKIQRLQVRNLHGNPSLNQLGILFDSTFRDLATLTLYQARVPRTTPRDFRQSEIDGTIEYKGKTYPIYFDLRANAEWIVAKKGEKGFMLFDFNFPSGSWHYTEPEERFLQDIGMIGEVFALDIRPDKTMTWRGLNRGIQQVVLVKQ